MSNSEPQGGLMLYPQRRPRTSRRKQMGRPLNKRYFGPPTPGGNEIKVQFYDSANTNSVNGWIVKQLGSKKFRVTDGTVTEDCVLVDKASAALAAGEMTITVLDDGGTPRQVTKISGRKVTADDGNTYPWTFDDSTSDDKVEMEEAGDDTTIDAGGTDEDDFESDDPV